MRSSNYIKFVTRYCWASLSYCINIDARPEISQCIYFLTTLGCLVGWNMGSGLFKGLARFAPNVQKNITVFTSYIKNYWGGLWSMLEPNWKSLWCCFTCWLSDSLTGDDRAVTWLSSCESFHSVFPKAPVITVVQLDKALHPCYELHDLPFIDIFSVSLTVSHTHTQAPTPCTK